MIPILKKKVGASVSNSFVFFYAPGFKRVEWPGAEIKFFKNYLILEMPFMQVFKIKYYQISLIKKSFGGVTIKHKNPKVGKYVYLWYPLLKKGNLFEEIASAVKKNKLKIKMRFKG